MHKHAASCSASDTANKPPSTRKRKQHQRKSDKHISHNQPPQKNLEDCRAPSTGRGCSEWQSRKSLTSRFPRPEEKTKTSVPSFPKAPHFLSPCEEVSGLGRLALGRLQLHPPLLEPPLQRLHPPPQLLLRLPGPMRRLPVATAAAAGVCPSSGWRRCRNQGAGTRRRRSVVCCCVCWDGRTTGRMGNWRENTHFL